MCSPGDLVRSRLASAAILRTARQGAITLVVSVPLALQYEAICSEAEHRLAAGLSEREVEIFLDAVVAMAEPVKTHFKASARPLTAASSIPRDAIGRMRR
jgi:hypothetical protein